MEGIGAISSALSLLDIAVRSSNAIHNLVLNWRDVPIEIVALSNEVNDSKAVLNQACYILRQFKHIPTTQTLDVNSPGAESFALDIERQLKQAIPIWEELQDSLRKFGDQEDGGTKCSKSTRFRWLKYREKIEQMKRCLYKRWVNIMELIVSSSAYRGHMMDMHLVSLSTDIRDSQKSSAQTSILLKQRMADIESRISLVSDGQRQGFQEVFNLFASCRLALQNSQSPATASLGRSCPGICSKTDAEKSFDEGTGTSRKHEVLPRYEPSIRDPVQVSAKYSALLHLTLHQSIPLCNPGCKCTCHSRNWSWQMRYGNSACFKAAFGSLFLGYSGVPTPNNDCNVSTCAGSAPGSTVAIRYSFPTWVANRTIISAFSSHPNVPHFWVRISRRIPYMPGNIFSRINSKDFAGAIKLIETGIAHVNDTETRHGNSVLGAAMRRPKLSPGFVRFIEFLLQRQADPFVPNDKGESASHFAARLMLPNNSTTTTSKELQCQLRRLFPNPDWDIFQFTHLHKVVAGLRPVNLAIALDNPIHHSRVNVRDALGQTPLALAAMLGDDTAVETLLLAGADVNPDRLSGTTFNPLRKAVKSENTRCVELLLMTTANPRVVDGRGATLLHTAAAGLDTLALIRPLLLSGIDLDSKNTHDCTPLSFTPLHDNHRVARFLVSQGAKIDTVDKDGDTPLTEAIRLNAHNCLRLFLERGADVRTINHRGWTILHFAAAYGDVETIRILTSSHPGGVETQAHSIQGMTARDYLLERQDVPYGVPEAFESLLGSLQREEVLADRSGVQVLPPKPSVYKASSEEAQVDNNVFFEMKHKWTRKLYVMLSMVFAWTLGLALIFYLYFYKFQAFYS
ncbi:ankyrin repeat-containing domain protein [Ilyonectria destructans]|nr:ankyrin repeat-containing domain protein [Ilyonectria destructans]